MAPILGIGIIKCENGLPVKKVRRDTREGHDWFFKTHRDVFEQSFYNDGDCEGLPPMEAFTYGMQVDGVCKELKFIGTRQMYEDFLAGHTGVSRTMGECQGAYTPRDVWMCVEGKCTSKELVQSYQVYLDFVNSTPNAYFTEEACRQSGCGVVEEQPPKTREYWRCLDGVCTLSAFEGTLADFKSQILSAPGNFTSQKDCQNACEQEAPPPGGEQPPWEPPGTGAGFNWYPLKFFFQFLKGFIGGS